MAITFDNFSPQAFERLVQALAVHVLGAGVVCFGPGPDGGREAYFEGEIPYPSSADRWNGYIVVQAKCRERLRHDATDADWLASQVAAELAKFADVRRGLRKPDYYLLCSNVSLSGEARNGGRVKIDRVFETYAKTLGMRSWSVWSAHELRTLLENAHDVRAAYTAWITPSDVLARLVDSIERKMLRRLLPLVLARDIRDERDARLQADQEFGKGVKLDDLFVDLPVAIKPATAYSHPIPSSSTSDEGSAAGVVAHLLRRCEDRFDSGAVVNQQTSIVNGGLPNRIVLLGGPGQGKSTVGQFIAQIFRARLLQACTDHINPQAREVAALVLERAAAEALPSSGPARFPIRIDLPSFSAAQQVPDVVSQSQSLAAFMAATMSRRVDTPISVDDLRAWLAACPSIIILDGLDEVPPGYNRERVTKAIDELWDDLSFANADAIVIVTTRPQGYDQSLEPRYWQHWSLSPLEPREALRYAERLSEIRLSNPAQRDLVQGEIRRAIEDPATAHLMSSPLQVTILHGIAILRGTIPRDRWDLFDRYYTLVRDRETEKPGPTGKTIRDYRQQIDALHREAGFVLHLSAESSPIAYLTQAQFSEAAERLLRSQGYHEDQVLSISRELVRVATDRLVLLRAYVEGQIAFDVRSLQEFMAAAEITSCRPELIVRRLRSIALSSHWRHVFRICASKIFSVGDFEYLRDDVLSLCHSIDSGDLGEAGRMTRSGARLALDLASDGVAIAVPRYHQQLFRRALALLDIGPHAFDQRLTGLISESTAEVFRAEVAQRLQQGRTATSFCAWVAAFHALSRDTNLAESLITRHWPKADSDLALAILATVPLLSITSAVHSLALESQWDAGPEASLLLLNKLLAVWSSHRGENISVIPGVIQRLLDNQFNVTETVRCMMVEGPQVSIYLPLVRTDAAAQRPAAGGKAEPLPTQWEAFAQVVHFVVTPNPVSLAQAVASIEQSGFGLKPTYLSWVLDSVLQDACEGVPLRELADAAVDGQFGNLTAWRDAQSRLFRRGVCASDVSTWSSGRYLSSSIGVVGVPYFTRYGVSHGSASPKHEELQELVRAIADVPQAEKRARLVEAVVLADEWGQLSRTNRASISDLVLGLLQTLGPMRSDELIRHLSARTNTVAELKEYFIAADAVGRKRRLVLGALLSDDFLRHFNRDPSLRGLLTFIAEWSIKISADHNAADLFRQLHASAYEFAVDDEPPVRASVAQLRLFAKRWSSSDVESLVEALTCDMTSIDLRRLVALMQHETVATHSAKGELVRALATRVLTAYPSHDVLLLNLVAIDCAEQRSPLTIKENRDALRLPSLSRAESEQAIASADEFGRM